MIDLIPGNALTLLRDGTEYFPALERAIDAAREEIYLETYIYEYDATGRRIAEALKRAARRGVAVHLLVDGFGAKDLPQAAIDDLRVAGVNLLVYRPDISPWTLRRSRLRRLHRKVSVFDACVGFVGGINIIDDVPPADSGPPRVDFAVRVEGPIVDAMHHSVARLWVIVAWTQFKRRWRAWALACAPNPARGDIRAAFVVRDNLAHRRDIEQAYLEAIGNARSEIIVANAYFLPGISLRRALMAAAARGVRVVLLLQGRIEYRMFHHASRALYGSFLDAGIEIHEYTRTFLHAKVAVVDGLWATVGSSNIDPFSLLVAREANVVVENAGFAGRLRRELLECIESGAGKVVRERWARQPLHHRMLSWICYGMIRASAGVLGVSREKEYA